MRWAAVALLALLATSGATRWPGPGSLTAQAPHARTVEGTVVDLEWGEPVSGVRITLLDAEMTPHDSTVTDAHGRFTLSAPGPGDFLLDLHLPGHLPIGQSIRVGPGGTRVDIQMPIRSIAAAQLMHEAIQGEAALQGTLEEICEEPLRPWEAGMLVGVTRSRRTLDPIAGAVVTLELADAEPTTNPSDEPPQEPAASRATRVSTDAGIFWFCNVPAGEVRIMTSIAGTPADTSYATIRAGTISWSDTLLGDAP